MKTKSILMLAWLAVLTAVRSACAQGTAFTYQGRLNDGANPAIGIYDLRFTLFDSATAGTQQGSSLTNSAMGVTNGLFMVALDFGANVFTGDVRWLEIGVRSNGSEAFTTLVPRQEITPTPYAFYAPSAGTAAAADSVAAANISGRVALAQLPGAVVTNNATGATLTGNFFGNFGGSFFGTGSGLTGVNATTLGGLDASGFWKTTGNGGTAPDSNFVGTTDQQALELKVAGRRAFRLEPATNNYYGFSPNVIGGYESNSVAPGVVGATIAGGGRQDVPGNQDLSHHITANHGTIGGGDRNTVSGEDGTVAGGGGNWAGGSYSTIAGGLFNSIQTNADESAIGGGAGNSIGTNAANSFIGGGDFNQIQSNAQYATIPGGAANSVSGSWAFAAGHQAHANHSGTFVWADSQNAGFASAAANQFLIRAGGGVGIGTATTPPGGLRVGSGGLAVTGASSPNYGTNGGVYIEWGGTQGNVFAFDYGPFQPRPLVLNSPGGNVGIGRTPTANALEVAGNASKDVAGSWLANSDARIKQEIQPVSSALEKLARVQLVSFRYTEDYRRKHPAVENRRYLNVVAQEFRDVFPDDVKSSGEKLPDGSDDILQVDTYPLTIYSAAAIQELNQKLNAELKQKETELTELRQRLEALERVIRNQKPN